MPSAQEHIEKNIALRIAVYGPAFSKKTWWALRAAEAGYRVLLLDFENKSGIVRQIPEKYLDNIYILPLHDDGKNAYAKNAAVTILKEYNFYINEETRRITRTPQIGSKHIDMRNFGRDTVVVFDSYSAIVESTWQDYANTHNIDLSNADKDEWPGYGWTGRLLSWMLNQIEHFPCPVILIGHEAQNVIKKKVLGGASVQKNAPIEMVRRQIYSSSNPHGMGICRHFTDILYLYAQGSSFKIDTRGDKQADGGCQSIPPGLYDWETLTFGAVADSLGITPPVEIEPWDFPIVNDQLAANTTKPIIIGGKTEPGTIKKSVNLVPNITLSAPKGSGLTFKR